VSDKVIPFLRPTENLIVFNPVSPYTEIKLSVSGTGHMKKAIVIFILLVIAAGTALYFGWVNVKPGFFGIAHSTLTGTVDYPLESGKIHWFWQKLIPKSFHLYMVERKPVNQSFITTHSLPGSQQLDEFGTFNLTIQTDIQYRVEYETARMLIERGLYEGFDDYFAGIISTRVNEAVAGFVLDKMMLHSEYDEAISYGMLDRLEKSIDDGIMKAAREYELADASWSITYVEIPQIDLYNDALERYFSHLEKVYRFKEEELDRESEQLALVSEYDMEIERWERYGELIKKYPELLKFFYIEKFSAQADVLVIPQNEQTGFPKMLEPWEFLSRTAPKTVQTPETKEDKQAPVPEAEEETPSTTEQTETLEEPEPGTREYSDQDTETPDDRTWYEKLMFWKYMGTGDGEQKDNG
jgi:hypothetical protein